MLLIVVLALSVLAPRFQPFCGTTWHHKKVGIGQRARCPVTFWRQAWRQNRYSGAGFWFWCWIVVPRRLNCTTWRWIVAPRSSARIKSQHQNQRLALSPVQSVNKLQGGPVCTSSCNPTAVGLQLQGGARLDVRRRTAHQ